MNEINGLKNSEILFIYEAKNCNPNGDPDEENRPRIDPRTRKNLVSDVRLKRFFRDYVASRFGEQYVFVTKVSGQHVRADQRIEKFKSDERVKKLKDRIKLGEEVEKKSKKEIIEIIATLIPRLCIDARLFGATIPIGKGEGARGAQRIFIGPVQFAWGFSLHPVELIESSTITSVFTGREVAEQYGTMGKDWRLYYSLISFYGVVSGKRAIQTGLNEDDLKLFDNLLWKSIILEATTRSKIGHKPHLYLRIEYKDSETLIGDFRRYIDTEIEEPIRDLDNVKPKFDRLLEVIKENKDKTSRIYINTSEDFEAITSLKSKLKKIIGEGIFEDLPHELGNEEIRKILERDIV